MVTPPRELFTDTDPAVLLADFAYVAARMQRDVAAGRRSVADATFTLSAAWQLLGRLLLADPVPLPIDTPPRLPLSC